MAIKVSEALRLPIMTVSWLIGIGGYIEGTIKYVTEGSENKVGILRTLTVSRTV